ncbi:MAG: glycosyltransferase family 39 protein [Anaerolineae bacterium]|nr:glycosyltransferase family 39 protein [Anaerolineae bacterium]
MEKPGGTRTLTNLMLAIGAFAAGLIAQRYFGGLSPATTPVDGLLVYAVAGALFAVALARTRRSPALPVRDAPQEVTRDAFCAIPAALVALSAGLAASFALHMFGAGIETRASWALYLLSIALYCGAVYPAAPARRAGSEFEDAAAARLSCPAAGRRASAPDSLAWAERRVLGLARWEWLALLLVLLLALAFRVARFGDLPYGLWYDEADNGLSVRRILQSPDTRPIYVPSTNLPAHFLYLIALSTRVLGDSVRAIRAVSVAFGMLTVVAAYLCGRELFAGRGRGALALILAFLLAVSRWDVNWSRIGMHGVTLPFFELWVVAALLRGLRTGRLPSFAWAGVAMGLGLCFYSPFRIFPVVVGGFLLAWGWRWLRQQCGPLHVALRRGVRAWTLPGTLFVLGALVAVAPVAQFALRNPDLFWDRARRISVLQDPRVRERPIAAIAQTTAKHLLMFNYRGDPNGRHNLPGAPMLDQFSGVLLVLGVLACLVRWDGPRSTLLLLWLLLPLSGGILSTWFEAPQSLRTLGAMPAAYAIACLPVEWMEREWRRVFPRRTGQGLYRPALAALVLLAAIGLENGVVYFYYWARDFASWAAFNPAETHMAGEIMRYQDRYDLRFDPLLTAHLATRYLAPDYGTYVHFDPAMVLPLRGTDKEGVILFVAPDTRALRAQIAALYPEAKLETFEHESGVAVLFKYTFSRDVIAAAQGLDARYTPIGGAGADGLVRVDREVNLSLGASSPLSYPFRVTWTGGLLAPDYGGYAIEAQAPGACTLSLDGTTLLEGTGRRRRNVQLAQGVHALRMDCRVTGAGAVTLRWQPPGGDALVSVPGDALYRPQWVGGGLLARFYPNESWSGELALARLDRQVAHYFHFLVLPRPYTVEWRGRLLAPVTGVYKLAVKAISSASLSIDGGAVIPPSALGALAEVEVFLAAGIHDLALRFLDDAPHSQIYLYWQPPEGEMSVIPPEVLYTPQDGAWWSK